MMNHHARIRIQLLPSMSSNIGVELWSRKIPLIYFDILLKDKKFKTLTIQVHDFL